MRGIRITSGPRRHQAQGLAQQGGRAEDVAGEATDPAAGQADDGHGRDGEHRHGQQRIASAERGEHRTEEDPGNGWRRRPPTRKADAKPPAGRA